MATVAMSLVTGSALHSNQSYRTGPGGRSNTPIRLSEQQSRWSPSQISGLFFQGDGADCSPSAFERIERISYNWESV